MPNRVLLDPPPTQTDSEFSFIWSRWFESIFDRVGGGPFKLKSYSRTGLPPAADWGSTSATEGYSSLIFVHNAVQGPSPAYSDGSNWKSVINGANV